MRCLSFYWNLGTTLLLNESLIFNESIYQYRVVDSYWKQKALYFFFNGKEKKHTRERECGWISILGILLVCRPLYWSGILGLNIIPNVSLNEWHSLSRITSALLTWLQIQWLQYWTLTSHLRFLNVFLKILLHKLRFLTLFYDICYGRRSCNFMFSCCRFLSSNKIYNTFY